MTERVEITNIALNWIGEKSITSLEEDSDKARVMKINYIPTRDATLEAHDWSFAMERFIPAQSSESPVWGAERKFQVPANILRVIGAWADDRTRSVRATNTLLIDTDEQIDWVLEENFVVCDEELVHCKGIKRVEEEGRFSPLFVQAFAANLAMQAALPLASSKTILVAMTELYTQKIMEAKTRDGLQGRSKRIRQRSLRKVR